MPAPLAKGLIITASILVAAGIAIYESPQVRQWLDQSRRKIATALHSLGDEIQPRRPSESSQDFEARKRRRDELIRKNRNELIRQAREEGIAVDLDELARIGEEDVNKAEKRARGGRVDNKRSFDDLVGSDGKLKKDSKAQTATGTDASGSGLRQRGVAGFAAGSAAAAVTANPFSDDHVLFDHDDEDEAPSPHPFTYEEPGTRETSATLENEPAFSAPASTPTPLIDLTPESALLQPEDPQIASIPQSEADDADQAAQSFYSFTSSASNHRDIPAFEPFSDNEEAENISTGTLTPRSEHSAFTGASVVGSQADDIAILSMQNDTDHDARSEVFSEGGFTDAGFSEAGFSELGHGDRAGMMTPNSWTDVGSDDESDWGGPGQGGHVSQIHQ